MQTLVIRKNDLDKGQRYQKFKDLKFPTGEITPHDAPRTESQYWHFLVPMYQVHSGYANTQDRVPTLKQPSLKEAEIKQDIRLITM